MMIDRCYIEITNTCNLDCHFCPKHHRKRRQLSEEEFDLLTDRVRGKVCFLYFCKALIKQIGVLSDGSLVPCCLDHDGDVILGNLFHQSLEEILASPRAQALVEGFRHHAATEPLCQSCESALVNKSFRGKKRK